VAFVASDETWRPPDWFDRVLVVLMETQDAVNIGGVIRSMANTGFARLRLVRPVSFDPWEVIGIAHYTQHIIDAARFYDSLPAAVGDTEFVLGLTGTHHTVERNQLTFADAMQRVSETAQAGQRAALVLGREDWGLSNTMLDACHAVTTIPTNPAHPSLNLAQAALLTLHDLFRRSGGGEQTFRGPRRASPPAPSALLEDLFADMERGLDAFEFLKSRSREQTLRSLRVALYRARLSVREASLVRALFLEFRHFLKRRGVISEIGPVGAQREP
jgi:TrmH family RNA methyltransferase